MSSARKGVWGVHIALSNCSNWINAGADTLADLRQCLLLFRTGSNTVMTCTIIAHIPVRTSSEAYSHHKAVALVASLPCLQKVPSEMMVTRAAIA